MKEITVKITILDPEMNKKIWMLLVSNAYDAGLTVELCDFVLEHPDLSLQELDRQFRNEWDL